MIKDGQPRTLLNQRNTFGKTAIIKIGAKQTLDMIGNLIERQFKSGNNWPLGAALSIMLIVITLILVKIYQKLGGDMDSLGV